MKKSNWVNQAITVFSFLTAIMLLMNAAPTIPVLAGEYDLSGSIEAAKKAEAEFRQSAEKDRQDAKKIKEEMYAESKDLYELMTDPEGKYKFSHEKAVSILDSKGFLTDRLR